MMPNDDYTFAYDDDLRDRGAFGDLIFDVVIFGFISLEFLAAGCLATRWLR